MTPKQELQDALLDPCWQLWTLAGVRGTETRKALGVPVALEELMLLTAQLGERDPRLRDEALDWCVKNHRFIARARLKTLLARLPQNGRRTFGPWVAAMREHVGGNWPDVKGPVEQQVRLSGKSTEPDLGRPELIHLRLRALFGVGARADVIGATLAWPSPTFIASELTYLGYSKRNLSTVLDWLVSGGLLGSVSAGNQLRFSWKRRTQLVALISPLPKFLPRWPLLLELLSVLLDLVSSNEGKSDRVASVSAAKAFSALQGPLNTLGLEPPRGKPASWTEHCSWIVDKVIALREGTSRMLHSGTAMPGDRR